MDNRERGTHARGVYPMQDTSPTLPTLSQPPPSSTNLTLNRPLHVLLCTRLSYNVEQPNTGSGATDSGVTGSGVTDSGVTGSGVTGSGVTGSGVITVTVVSGVLVAFGDNHLLCVVVALRSWHTVSFGSEDALTGGDSWWHRLSVTTGWIQR